MKKFWNWVQNDGEPRTLHLEGAIAEETWWGDEVTPQMFKNDLTAGSGDIIVWINSPGGDVFAAAQIYNMLMDYRGDVTVKIDLSRTKLSHMMDAESWMNAKKAVELGFADDILFSENAPEPAVADSMIFSRQTVTNSFLRKLPQKSKNEESGTSIESLMQRLNLISH